MTAESSQHPEGLSAAEIMAQLAALELETGIIDVDQAAELFAAGQEGLKSFLELNQTFLDQKKL